jgi:DNA-binding CsgD family transcriptional regulator
VFIQKVSNFATFLGLRQHTIEEILAHLTYRVFENLETTSVFISILNNKNRVEILGQYGIDPSLWKVYPQETSLFDKYPSTDALRTRRAISVNTLPDWGPAYPTLTSREFALTDRTFICIPVEKCNTPVAVLGLFCAPVIELDSELEAYIGAISNLLSLYMYRTLDAQSVAQYSLNKSILRESSVRGQKLTERQNLILRMIHENRTNVSISEILGYSESTIRQETIKIYAKLGCHGREEASRVYREIMNERETHAS